MIHKEIYDFYNKQYPLNCASPASGSKDVKFYYHNIREILCVESEDDVICKIDGKWYFQDDALRIIKLKVFL